MSEKKVDRKKYIIGGVDYSVWKDSVDSLLEHNPIFISEENFYAKKIMKWFKKKYPEYPKGWITYLDGMLQISDSVFRQNEHLRGWQYRDKDEKRKSIEEIYELIDLLKDKLSEENFMPVFLNMYTRNNIADDNFKHKMIFTSEYLDYLKTRIEIAVKALRTSHKDTLLEREYAHMLDIFFRETLKVSRMPNDIIHSIICLKFPESNVTSDDIKRWRYANKKGRLHADVIYKGVGYKKIT